MSILLLAEHDNQVLKPATLNALGAAAKLNLPTTVLVVGHQCAVVAQAAAQLQGVSKVLVVDDAKAKHPLAEVVASSAFTVASQFQYILAPSTGFGKNALPRLAALLDVAQVSDVLEIIDGKTFKRPIYAGNVIATVQSHDAVVVMTIRTTSFDPVTQQQAPAPIEALAVDFSQLPQVQHVKSELAESARPELTAAKVVVSGGRALGSAENFALLEGLADALNAAIGASRAAVDAGYAPNDWQVGQTGKIVAPQLYIAVGISGAIQHLAGMKDSKVIVAINKDPDAPIFAVADYGLVGDLFEIVPELTAQLGHQ